MDDEKIIDLYFQRSEQAITQTASKYSAYCGTIAYNILQNSQDAEETTNDTYLKAWNTMPPQRPNCLPAFLGRITRNLAINKYNQRRAKKRGENQIALALSELEECIPSHSALEEESEAGLITRAVNAFLAELPQEKRSLFVKRYWYLMSLEDMAKQHSMSLSKVKSLMLRLRKALKQKLEEEGIVL